MKERDRSESDELQTGKYFLEKKTTILFGLRIWICFLFAKAGRSQTLSCFLHRKRRQIMWRKTGLGSGNGSVSHSCKKKNKLAAVSGWSVALRNLFLWFYIKHWCSVLVPKLCSFCRKDSVDTKMSRKHSDETKRERFASHLHENICSFPVWRLLDFRAKGDGCILVLLFTDGFG